MDRREKTELLHKPRRDEKPMGVLHGRTVTTMADMTYCVRADCLDTECERHPTKISNETGQFISIADFGGVCREYLYQVLVSVSKRTDGDNDGR